MVLCNYPWRKDSRCLELNQKPGQNTGSSLIRVHRNIFPPLQILWGVCHIRKCSINSNFRCFIEYFNYFSVEAFIFSTIRYYSTMSAWSN